MKVLTDTIGSACVRCAQRALPVVDEYVVPADDYLRCFAVVVPAEGPFCTRVSTLVDLLQVDKEVTPVHTSPHGW